jgi:hypothetical protein
VTPVGACERDACPVPQPGSTDLRRLRTHTLPSGTVLRRGHKVAHSDPSTLVSAVGDTRFASPAGTRHVYAAATTFAALLESAFHDAAPPAPRMPVAMLGQWAEAEVALRRDVRLIDLRDPELDRLGIARTALVATSAAHYPCTREWARVSHNRRVSAPQAGDSGGSIEVMATATSPTSGARHTANTRAKVRGRTLPVSRGADARPLAAGENW